MAPTLSSRTLALLLWTAGLLTAVLWLGSLERYLGARYHWDLEWLQESPLAGVSRLRERLQDEISGQVPEGLITATAFGKGRWKAPPPALDWTALPAPLPPGAFLGDLRQQKLRPGPQRRLSPTSR